MDVRLVALLFFFVSCMPQSEVSRGNVSGQNPGTTTSGTDGGTAPTNIPPSATTWNFLSTSTNSITINVSNLVNSYIVGSEPEKYLGTLDSSNVLMNFTNVEYCAVSDYSLGGVKLQLRTRAVPIAYYDFTAKRVVRVFRVDFDDVSNSATLCSGTLQVQNSGGTFVDDVTAPASPVFAPAQLCPNCTSMVTSTKVRLFRKELNLLKEVPTPSVNTGGLILSVDPNASASGSAGSCSNSECKLRGFDCCLDNQCVKDGTPKPSASTQYNAQYLAVQQERIQNPLAYINYPHIYYVCGTVVPPASTTSGGSNGGGGVNYDEAFAQLKKDYSCVEHIKAQAQTAPFHNELLNRSYTAAADCLTANGQIGQTMHYQEVMKRLYKTCGCSKTNLNDMIASCPAYDYVVTQKDAAGAPTRIDCYTPPTVEEIPTLRTVTVNSRSAPHRFFESVNGLEKDILGNEKTYTLAGKTYDHVQEGEKFEYLDDHYVVPSQKDYSMNAILGQMRVSLDRALPAKAVAIDIDKVYMISTQSGYYTPCPTCAKDSWINSFSAFPSSSQGVGLQAVGHSTERDALSTNYTAGNYEDTIFGRACWIPPTMIPFTHSNRSTRKDQRNDRLNAQAALFVNGYQRDWFGFNKGALIGSFDGVTWFSIGKGRIVRSTSKKLFLAINAPFADLATPSLHVVQIQDYDGFTQAASVDYNPDYHMSHPEQNEAGNCQAFHQCRTDTDCVTKLGWEYACNDVRDVRTNWPEFDVDGNEKENKANNVTIEQILQQKRFPTSTTKRCVYRGAGAPCVTNSGAIPNMDTRRNLTCAPNFYCAPLTTSVFNTKIARWAAKLEDIPVANNHAFGRDANILGRPLNYATGSSALTSDIRSSINENIGLNSSTASAGICRPGRKLPTTAGSTLRNPYEQHKEGDSLKRTDFINQIGSCNVTAFHNERYNSCPTFNADGNFEIFGRVNPAIPDWRNGAYVTGFETRARSQNSCGLDNIHSDVSPATLASGTPDSLLASSAFKLLEAKPLPVAATIADRTFARDACFRRAGAVCHTDLDCSPNKYQADLADTLNVKFFGNLAEQSLHKEYLVCGQGTAKPFPSNAEAFRDYDMSLNRCCREIGKDLTTYTPDTGTNVEGTSYSAATAGLNVATNTGTNPNSALRYTRFTSVDTLGGAAPYVSASTRRNGTGDLTDSRNIGTANQWKTISTANSKTCCGGGFIRKFSDGTTDWTKNNRLYLDVNNFKCINSRTVLLTDPARVAEYYGTSGYGGASGLADVKNLVARDFFNYCMDAEGATGSCAQYAIESLDYDRPVEADQPAYHYPKHLTFDTGALTVNTIDPNYLIDTDAYFPLESADLDPNTTIDFGSEDANARRNIRVKIPSWISRRSFDHRFNPVDGDTGLNVYLGLEKGQQVWQCKYSALLDGAQKVVSPTDKDDATTNRCDHAGARCCYTYDKNNRILTLIPDQIAYDPGGEWEGKRVGVRFSIGAAGGEISFGAPATSGIKRGNPGTSLHYLRRLGQLELSGIPQISFEPIYCSDDANKLVPGIFNKNKVGEVRAEFENSSHAYKVDGAWQTNQHALSSEAVFSGHEFKCCAKLGSIVDKADKCCSGYGKEFGDGTAAKCMLPPGTDLMVYFNRFVSNEGLDENGPGGGLKPEDFDPRTGEPGMDYTKKKTVNGKQWPAPFMTKAIDKIKALGNEYCDSSGSPKVRQGGAFGEFAPEPFGPKSKQNVKFTTIVDSSRDFGQSSNAGSSVDVGYNEFMNGFRWNHHLYCNGND